MEEKKLYKTATQMSPEIYKDFYRFYYADRLKVFRVIATVVGIMLLLGAMMMFYGEFKMIWIALSAWVGLFLLVYPNVAYRRPYKRARDQKLTTYFTFYENRVEERTNVEKGSYDYSSLLKVVETPKYLFIYHTKESISIVIKSEVKDGADGLCRLLNDKTENYKKVK